MEEASQNPEPICIKLFLALLPNKVTQHRVAAVLKRFYRFMYENIDEKYRRIYESFKATPPKLKDHSYLNCQMSRKNSC